EQIAIQIDEEVSKLIGNALKSARKIIKEQGTKLELVAKQLLTKETIERKEFEGLMKTT
ncbi:MAG: hypothetical protein HYS15_03590, partial [Candidatus Spechtbacteria bacterium]|nr:hypothetical protein [Candidatus Spechtbacteria bacterium]